MDLVRRAVSKLVKLIVSHIRYRLKNENTKNETFIYNKENNSERMSIRKKKKYFWNICSFALKISSVFFMLRAIIF